jgi:hypothetical protein
MAKRRKSPSKKKSVKRGASSRAPRLRVSDVAGAVTSEESERYNRKQWSVTRTFAHTKIAVPMQSAVVDAIKAAFMAAHNLAKRKRFDYELSAYTLTVNVARRARVSKDKKVTFLWNKRDFIRLTSKLQTFGILELWKSFQENHLEQINDVKRAASIAKMPLSMVPASDPVGVRPAKITIYMQSAEGRSLRVLRGKNVSWTFDNFSGANTSGGKRSGKSGQRKTARKSR